MTTKALLENAVGQQGVTAQGHPETLEDAEAGDFDVAQGSRWSLGCLEHEDVYWRYEHDFDKPDRMWDRWNHHGVFDSETH